MKRREFITLLGGAAVAGAWSLAARAQPANMPRIGFLRFSTPASAAGRVEEFRTALRSLGYVEGRNIVIEYRFAETTDRLADMAAELARMKVDVIFAMSSTETERAWQATRPSQSFLLPTPTPSASDMRRAWRGRAATPPG
jgi:putative ABC transport system substrate-binding protein